MEKSLFLTNELRKELKDPIGNLIKGKEKEVSKKLAKALSELEFEKLIFVGDYLVNSHTSEFLNPDIYIFDGRVKRNKEVETKEPSIVTYNPPGSINKGVWGKLRQALESNKIENIYVKGEEDLLALPISRLSERNNIVVYGFFSKGVCYFSTEELDEDRYLSRMKQGKFEKVVLGGTFDRLHIGHQYFLKMSKEYGEKMVIGLSSQEMCGDKELAHKIQSYDKRKRKLESFLDSLGANYEIAKINDIYGPAKNRKNLGAIIITEETLENAKKINEERVKKEFPKLNYFILPYIFDESGKKISSTRIRKGLINRNGKLLN